MPRYTHPTHPTLRLAHLALLSAGLALMSTACTVRWPLTSPTPTPAGDATASERRPVRSLGLATTTDPNTTTPDGAAAGTPTAVRITPRVATPTRALTRRTAPDPATLSVTTEEVASGLDNPVAIANAGDGSGRLFVVEKEGRIRVIQDGTLLEEPFLDIRERVESESSERGLLGLAFHPDFHANGYFFVNYTSSGEGSGDGSDQDSGEDSGVAAGDALDRGDTVIARYEVGTDPDVADPSSAFQILTVSQPHANHNGGHLLFGPDGYLYIGLGDGGSQGDPDNRAQDLGDLLGKLLRIDVDTGDPDDPYDIPPDNPFADEPPARPEVWAYGLRNPWRYSFDRLTGDLYIGDVGGSEWEEINFQPADSRGGENYGWNIMEAADCYKSDSGCDQTDLTLPVAYYSHADGTAVTAGEVYRGRRFPGLVGTFFYGDYGTGTLWALSRSADGQWRNAEVGEAKGGLSAFGQGEDGEVYLALYSTGEVHRLVDAGEGRR